MAAPISAGVDAEGARAIGGAAGAGSAGGGGGAGASGGGGGAGAAGGGGGAGASGGGGGAAGSGFGGCIDAPDCDWLCVATGRTAAGATGAATGGAVGDRPASGVPLTTGSVSTVKVPS